MRATLFFFLSAAALFAQPADLVLRNGKIVTMNAAAPTVQAIAVRGDKITALGPDSAAARWIGPNTKVIDLHGQLAIPGFIEGHGHFTGVGEFRMGLDLREARTWDDIVAQVARAVKQAKPGEWIVGRGWHQSKWTAAPNPNVEGFPLHASLDKVSPNNPVVLTHASGHASFVNGKALELAGVTPQTPNPSGGEILKDAKGNPTGLLRERASGVISRARADYEAKRSAADRRAELDKAIKLAIDESLAKGITSFQDAGSPFSTIDVLKKMADDHQLRMRIWMMARVPNDQLAANMDRYRTIGDYFTVRGVKRAIDGALGSRGAWLLEPYTDKPESSGLNTDDPADIRKTAELAIQHNYQLCVHAIGDRANRETLNIFEETFKAHPEKKDLRWRVEHAQHISAQDIPRFGQLGVIPMMQGVHCTSDAPYVLLRLGPKRAEEGAYVWQKLMKTGAIVGNGTDAPVEDVSPLASYYASVSRKLKDGTVFYPDQRMSRMEALKSYTLNNAFAAFEEKTKGSLETGKLADITVLSKDILTIPEDEILATDIVYTIVGGKVAFAR
ncbi:MAG: Amidohydrolase 3 [Candidatus Solibacter sp.]|nr:Amidohydrolase 3 [Candidatus Solibacter sp.]